MKIRYQRSTSLKLWKVTTRHSLEAKMDDQNIRHMVAGVIYGPFDGAYFRIHTLQNLNAMPEDFKNPDIYAPAIILDAEHTTQSKTEIAASISNLRLAIGYLEVSGDAISLPAPQHVLMAHKLSKEALGHVEAAVKGLANFRLPQGGLDPQELKISSTERLLQEHEVSQ